jgi:predicted nucleic acid-binding protein
MIVVSDTSVISALIQVEHADLLPEIFGEVVIPVRVAEELAVSHPIPVPWLRIMAVRNRQMVAEFAERLDLVLSYFSINTWGMPISENG